MDLWAQEPGGHVPPVWPMAGSPRVPHLALGWGNRSGAHVKLGDLFLRAPRGSSLWHGSIWACLVGRRSLVDQVADCPHILSSAS